MIYEKFKRLKIDRTINAIIGISRKRFDDLVPNFANAHQEIQKERLAKEEIKRLPSGGKKGPLNDYEKQLFFHSLLLEKLSNFRCYRIFI